MTRKSFLIVLFALLGFAWWIADQNLAFYGATELREAEDFSVVRMAPSGDVVEIAQRAFDRLREVVGDDRAALVGAVMVEFPDADLSGDYFEPTAAQLSFMVPTNAADQMAGVPHEMFTKMPRNAFISVPVWGAYRWSVMRAALNQAKRWMDSNGYEQAGPPRRWLYSRPSLKPGPMFYSEVQVPVQRKPGT